MLAATASQQRFVLANYRSCSHTYADEEVLVRTWCLIEFVLRARSERPHRRVYYYLLCLLYVEPFFRPVAYSPTGSYADVTVWPPMLPLHCTKRTRTSAGTCLEAITQQDGFRLSSR